LGQKLGPFIKRKGAKFVPFIFNAKAAKVQRRKEQKEQKERRE
jgi:hypothetical protein